MHCLSRNKQTCHYALLGSVSEVTDSNGYYTGELRPSYGTATEIELNISPAAGYASLQPFGIQSAYSLKAVTHDINCPICEDTIMWVGVPTTAPHNYSVVQVAKSLNSISYYLKEVEA